MTKGLRKKHIIIWLSIAVVLPLAVLFAWRAVPAFPTQPLYQPMAMPVLPTVLRASHNKKYSIKVRANADSSLLQLEWTALTDLPQPATVIYASTGAASISENKLLGRIETVTHGSLALDSSFKHPAGGADIFILYDFIHQQVIDTINCRP